MKVRTTFPHIWFGSANHVGSGTGRRSGSYNDTIIIGSDQDGIRKVKQHLFSHFQTKDLGKLKYFLGIEIAQSNFDVVMSHRNYVFDILEETNMLDCKPVDTLIDPNVKFVPRQGEPLQDPRRY